MTQIGRWIQSSPRYIMIKSDLKVTVLIQIMIIGYIPIGIWHLVLEG